MEDGSIFIIKIIKSWLKEKGYDGLVNTELECGCGLDDLFPCLDPDFGIPIDCKPAYRNGKNGFSLKKPENCLWTCIANDYDGHLWKTSCSHKASFNYGDTPKDNKYKFCPYCGKKITLKYD